MRAPVVWIIAALCGVSVVAAQEARPRVEVTSVKRVVEPRRGSIWELTEALPRVRPGGRFSGTPITVEGLLMFAYDLKPTRVVGGPDWMRRDWYEIDAMAGSEVSTNQLRLMMQSLLEDRFKLVARAEQRARQYRALVRARAGGALGPGLITIDECSATKVSELRRNAPEQYPMPGSGLTSGCTAPGLATFADGLAIALDVPVIDATGLTGSFYYHLRTQFQMFPPALRLPDNDSGLPALSTALDEQFGIRLESRRGPVEVLVIDSVQPPTDN